MCCQNTAQLNFCCILQHKQQGIFKAHSLTEQEKKKYLYRGGGTGRVDTSRLHPPEGGGGGFKNGNHLQLIN